MAIRESQGKFYLVEPVQPEWQESDIPNYMWVVKLEAGAKRDLWALAQGPRHRSSLVPFLAPLQGAFSGRDRVEPSPPAEPEANRVPVVGYDRARRRKVDSYVLRFEPEVGWTTQARLAGECIALALLHDGTLAVGGEGLLALRSPDGAWTAQEAPAQLTRVWGASAQCVYALGQRFHGKGLLGKTGVEATWVSGALFYFDGKTWAEIDLEARGLHGFFADGACDANGDGWIVGTYATHSCMARGKGTEWEPDGCGSWYLYHVHVDRTDRAFALGGDGLWRLHDGRWEDVEAYGRDIGWPLALSSVEGQPWTIEGCSPWDQIEKEVSNLDLFLGTMWVTLRVPGGRQSREMMRAYAISKRGEVFLGAGSRVWRSPPLKKLLASNWPPRRLTPEDDPQLESSEPLVRSWLELQGSWQLDEWGWHGDGLIGALEQRKVTELVRWHQLSDTPDTICEFEFSVSQLSVAPSGNPVAIVPEEVDQRGVFQGARRLMLVDLETGTARETRLPPEFQYSVLFTYPKWSPDGSRFLIEPERPLDSEKSRTLLVFRSRDLALEQTFEVPHNTHVNRWDRAGIVLYFESLLASPFHGVPAGWLDPTTGELRRGDDRLDISPSGRYRVTLSETSIEVTTLADGTARRFEPNTGGVLDVAGKEGRPSIVNASWVGDRLELRAKLLGPVHLDLETMELRYALPQRAEHEALPSWNPDGCYVLRRDVAAVGHEVRDRGSWSWGRIEE